MIIRINKCSSPGAWYLCMVGQTIEVERYEVNRRPEQGIPEDVYWCREGGVFNCLNFVRASDATVVDYVALPLGTILAPTDLFKRKRNKIWRTVPRTMVGRPITKLHVKRGFEFRRA